MVFLVVLAVLLIAAIAYWWARDGHVVDVSRGVTAFLLLFALLGWTLYARESLAQDRTLDHALATMRGLVEMVQDSRAATDSTRGTVDALLEEVGS